MAEPFEVPIPLRSNPGEFSIDGLPRVFNAYAVKGAPDRKSQTSLVPCTGLKTFSDDAEGRCRGMMWIEDEDEDGNDKSVLYSVNGIRLYSYDKDGNGTEEGLMIGSEPIIWARNNAAVVQTLVHSESYVYSIVDGAFGTYGGGQLPDGLDPPAGVTLVGGYFIIWEKGGAMFSSDLNDITFDALRFASAESDPDGLTSCIGVQNTLYAIGTRSTEVWQIDGTTGFPLSRIPGASIDFGSRSKHTVKEIDNSVYFVGSDNVVHVMNGYNSQAISTDEVSRLIEAEMDKNAIIAFTHTRSDNKFYTLQGTGWTREFNTKTGAWHDRFSDLENQWTAVHHQRAWDNRDFFGDRITGRVYEGDYEIYTEPDNPVVWGFQVTLLHNFPQGLSFSEVDLDVETGHGMERLKTVPMVNGNFNVDLAGWELYQVGTALIPSWDAGRMRFHPNASDSFAVTSVSVVAGVKHYLSFDYEGGEGWMAVGNAKWGNDLLDLNPLSTGRYERHSFVPLTDTIWIRVLIDGPGEDYWIDNIEFETADEDDAKLMLRWSDDGARTWRERHLPLGKRGEWNKKVSSKSLGQCGEGGRTFMVKVSDPVVRAISEMRVDARGVRR